jgi:hypothetical protein
MAVAATRRLEAQFSAGVWTNITVDIDDYDDHVTCHRGIDGDGPMDLVAGPGELHLALKNHARNSGGLVGYYSFGHANCRSGWKYGTPLRMGLYLQRHGLRSLAREGR